MMNKERISPGLVPFMEVHGSNRVVGITALSARGGDGSLQSILSGLSAVPHSR